MSGINEQVINAEIYQIGPQGIPGEAATVSVGTVTTGAPGTDASVINSGTSSAAILDFVIPQGAQGLQGIQGPQGIQGLTGATGNGIASIVKTGTAGLVDTYRITFTDNTYFDFDVTNGSSISDIEKTGTSGLVDTYTITLTNGDTHTFTVTNGAKGDKGETGEVGNGILGVNKMSTTGLVDNYRMTFTNGTYFDFDVANAKSIVSISKISTSGLIDTYRITFNDNTNFQFPVTNGRGITGVTLLSWEGLEKTYRMSFNDGSHFDFVVTNGAGSQVDWGGIYGVLSQQTDLQDALVQSNGLTMGSVSTYNVMLSELIERAHSTFDASKFTVVGSPNITSDGIASGFSGSWTNYIKTAQLPSISSGNNFEMKIKKVKFNNEAASLYYLANKLIFSYYNHYLNIYISSDGNGWDIANNVNVNKYLQTDTYYNIRFIFTGAKYQVAISTDDDNYTYYDVATSTTKMYFPTGSQISLSPEADLIKEIDLKQFSITVDGVEVFSGNKTGIDTIKPDDYTVVGSPTISADGVASGFSLSNCLETPTIDLSKPWKVELTSNGIGVPFSWGANDRNYFVFKSDRTQIFIAELNLNATVWTAVNLSTKYNVVFGWDGSEYYLNVYNLDGTLYLSKSITSSDACANSKFTIGKSAWDNSAFDGSIDLNTFKKYSLSNLVYQPCLKIPYTESKTGSKIVNSIYRDRVNDMSSQFGYANYYTLDENNGNFTLPQVELYGLIGDKTLRDSYYNGVTYWELYSNRRLEQGGNCESGVEYTLPKPFADANYVLTIPYSSKTATSFIPSATGDFIAKGTGLL